MNIVKITPRGYCHGVVTALNLVTQAIYDKTLPKPIYILGQIVHNQHLTDAFFQKDIITLDQQGKTRLQLLDEITTGTVILTAHGVSPEVIKKAKEKKLHIIDAVCSDVKKTHTLIADYTQQGYKIIYIGKKGHPEPEGALGIAPHAIFLVETLPDIEMLPLSPKNDKILITNQTTLSIWDVAKLAHAIEKKFPQAQFIKEICDATQTRQEAVLAAAPFVDLIIVLGDPKSNNTNRLAQIAVEAGTPAYRVENVTQINPFWFKDKYSIGITAGASTPTSLTKQAIQYLEQFNYEDMTTWDKEQVVPYESIIPRIRLSNKNK